MLNHCLDIINEFWLTVRLTLDEIAAAAELILAQDGAESKEVASGSESSDEGFGGEVDSDVDDEQMEAEVGKKSDDTESLRDSGYGSNPLSLPGVMETRYAIVFTHGW